MPLSWRPTSVEGADVSRKVFLYRPGQELSPESQTNGTVSFLPGLKYFLVSFYFKQV